MRMPSVKQLKSLEKATAAYEANQAQAMAYLIGRGITLETALAARIGVVTSPEPGHEHVTGRLSIPYMNKLGVIALKFRCIIGHDCKENDCSKYLCPTGQEDYLYGVLDADADADTIHVTEGETDRLCLVQVLGEPAVGIPGATKWEPHWAFHFKNWSRVLVWGDGDKAGQDFNRRVRKEVPAAEYVQMPRGHDVNSVLLELGAETIRRLAGLEEEE